MICDIIHIGQVNPQHIVSVKAYQGRRLNKHISREYLFWGRHRRSKDFAFNHWYPARVIVRLAGGDDQYIWCKSNARAERVRDEIIEELNRGRDSPAASHHIDCYNSI